MKSDIGSKNDDIPRQGDRKRSSDCDPAADARIHSQVAPIGKRDRSIDVLRGITTLSMVLVNTCPSPKPKWLSHPTSLNQPITFADTIFPCFLFTSGLAQSVSSTSSKPTSFKRALIRCIKLNVLGFITQNLIPRLIRNDRGSVYDLSSYRIPSVLGRIGISSFISSLESLLPFRPPIFPTLLTASWYIISQYFNDLEPLCATAQSKLDGLLFGSNHLYNPTQNFDPEGTLGSLLTAPVSLILGKYIGYLPWKMMDWHTSQLFAVGTLGILLTGLLPSPSLKVLWTPTFIGQTTSINLIYLSMTKSLTKITDNQNWMIDILAKIGTRSLEIYLCSTIIDLSLSRFGILSNRSIEMISNFFKINQSFSGVLQSSLLCFFMMPLTEFLIKFNLKLPI